MACRHVHPITRVCGELGPAGHPICSSQLGGGTRTRAGCTKVIPGFSRVRLFNAKASRWSLALWLPYSACVTPPFPPNSFSLLPSSLGCELMLHQIHLWFPGWVGNHLCWVRSWKHVLEVVKHQQETLLAGSWVSKASTMRVTRGSVEWFCLNLCLKAYEPGCQHRPTEATPDGTAWLLNLGKVLSRLNLETAGKTTKRLKTVAAGPAASESEILWTRVWGQARSH